MSGQFAILRGMWTDWREQAMFAEDQTTRAGASRELRVADAVFTITEMFEFAARLSLTSAGDEFMRVEISANDLRGRALVVGDPRRMKFIAPRVSSVDDFPQSFDLEREELVARTRDLAIDASIELFMRFGWTDVRRDALAEMQAELRFG